MRSTAKLIACRSFGLLRNSGRLVLRANMRRLFAGTTQKRDLLIPYLPRSSTARPVVQLGYPAVVELVSLDAVENAASSS